MTLSFQLRSMPGLAALQALLPSLLKAESVRIDDSAATLVCSVPDAEAAAFEAAHTDVLERLGLGWQLHARNQAEETLGREYSWADAVMTLIIPPDVAFPADIIAQLAEWNLQLRGVRRLSAWASNELAFELYLDDWARAAKLQAALPALAERWGVDVALAEADSKRPRRRLIAFDMDSTLIRCEVIDELASRAGVGETVAAITARAMRGELDFRASFRERMASLRGLDESALTQVVQSLPLMPGVESLLKTLRAQGHYTVILSGGFDYFARHLQEKLGFHELHANVLQIRDGALTGEVEGEIVDGERKRRLLERIAEEQGLAMNDTVAVGDGANDLPMISAAGLGVAFHAKPLVRERAPVALTHCDLTGLLYVLGVAGG